MIENQLGIFFDHKMDMIVYHHHPSMIEEHHARESEDHPVTALDLSCQQLTSGDIHDIREVVAMVPTLSLARNRIDEFARNELPCSLISLNLAENQLLTCTGFECLSHLRILHLEYNHLVSIAALSHCHALKELYLRGNRLEQLDGLEGKMALEILDVAENMIESEVALRPLSLNPKLRKLFIRGNPLSISRFRILHLIPDVCILDDQLQRQHGSHDYSSQANIRRRNHADSDSLSIRQSPSIEDLSCSCSACRSKFQKSWESGHAF